MFNMPQRYKDLVEEIFLLKTLPKFRMGKYSIGCATRVPDSHDVVTTADMRQLWKVPVMNGLKLMLEKKHLAF
jgi:hypothetical protein